MSNRHATAPRDADVEEDLRRVAQEVFGWRLRPKQLVAMREVMSRRDTLVVMPTGSGKSAIYQVPAILLDGATVVVSPLISLQRDQVVGLTGHHAPAAVAVNSAQGRRANDEAFAQARHGRAEYLFLSPEQLAKDEVVAQVERSAPSLFVVDEAHCISAWGYTFRPDYLRLGAVIERLDHPTVLALTATATPPVRADIVELLGMRDARTMVAGFDRPNLRLRVRQYVEDDDKRAGVVEHVLDQPRPGIVYTAIRGDTQRYAKEFARHGLRSATYHAGMRAADRRRAHDAFLGGDVDVMVATNAFGMGVDKPDVRFVVHASVPGSLDSYYQEIGRAGRDGGAADAVLCYRTEDFGLRRFFATRGPDEEALAVVAAMVRATGTVRLRQVAEQSGLGRAKLAGVANLLQLAAAVERTPAGGLRYVDPGLPVEEAVARAERVATRRERIDQSRVEMMRGYAETTGCRRQFLLGYFGEDLPHLCGNCDNCLTGVAQRPEATNAGFAVNTRLTHEHWGEGTVMRVEDDRMTVLFEEVGYKTLSVPDVLQRHLVRVRG